MKKIVLAMVMSIILGGLAMATGDFSKNTVVAGRLDKVHTAVLTTAAEQGYRVEKDVRYATAYHVELVNAAGNVQVCLQMEKNRTDVRVHGDTDSGVNNVLNGIRAKF